MASGGITVLVVDDEASIRLLCRVNLELEGYRVLEAGTLAEARAVLRDNRVDVLLLDVHIAGEDGREFVHEVRSEHARLPVAMLTGSVDTGEAGVADRVIPKPFAPEDLSRVVRELTAPDFEAHVDSRA